MLERGKEEEGRQGYKAGGTGRGGRTRGRETPMLSARNGYAQKHASGC